MNTLTVDEDYIRVRNKMIPEAEKYANKVAGVTGKGKNEAEREERVIKWNHPLKRADGSRKRNKGKADALYTKRPQH